MKRKLRNVLLFSGVIFLLQQLSYWMGTYHDTFRQQKAIMVREGIDPAVFFYTESAQALRAEKLMRATLNKSDQSVHQHE